MEKEQSIAMYLRLSIEDEYNDESNSIINQRSLIREYLSSRSEYAGWKILEYSDDGYSGMTFERPGIKELFKDMKRNLLHGIIVKDFSRFSRDYIEIGSYLDQIFPFMKIRFISINDSYDSRVHQGITIQTDTAFKTLLNDFYCKDLSAKVKSAVRSKCGKGEYIFGVTPLGYEKIQGRKHQLRVNEKEAAIVRYLFELAAKGISPVGIEKRFHEEQIPTAYQIRGYNLPDQDRIRSWSAGTIRTILDNRFYIGEFSYHKTEILEVGSKQSKRLPLKEWNTIPNHHEAIISRELFEEARYQKTGRSTERKHPKHPLTGKLYCGGCGYAMVYKRQSGKWPGHHFECRKHARLKIPACCTYYNAEVLKDLVLTMLNKELLKLLDPKDSREALKSVIKGRGEILKERNRANRIQIKKWEQEKVASYEAYASGRTGVEAYQQAVASADQRIAELQDSLLQRQKALMDTEKAYNDNLDGLKQVLRYSQVNELTQDIMDHFVHKIKVYRNKEMEIRWAFSSAMADIVADDSYFSF